MCYTVPSTMTGVGMAQWVSAARHISFSDHILVERVPATHPPPIPRSQISPPESFLTFFGQKWHGKQT